MGLLYSFLGVVARVGERLSHNRVNGIPLNWVVIVALGVLTVVGAIQARDAIVNGTRPRPVTVSQLLAHQDVQRNYVAVSGELHPEAGFERASEKNSDDVDAAWAPMLDAEGRRALLVQLARGTRLGGTPSDTTVTGMLIPLNTQVRKKLEGLGGTIDDVPIDTEYMLAQGRAPGSAATWIAVTALCGLLCLAFVGTFLTRYVVFRKASTGPAGYGDLASAPLPAEGVDLHVTGRFVLDEKNAQRFLDVPAALVTLESGEPALISNIDASTRYMGVTTAERVGVWAIVMTRDSLRNPEKGQLHVGLSTRPALRLRYVDGATGRPEVAILSVATEGERQALAGEINRAAGYGLVSV